ncbi:zinc metallopeptidase [[Eubacterium] hominis]|uniref:zinc metallopeptidase n=1 Tax=[Eubacterium] hominis TaxID=2764325 RepID=UPI003A4D2C56
MSINSIQYLLYILGFAIVMLAQARVQQVYNQYKAKPNARKMTGKDAARMILDASGLPEISVEVSRGGSLSDHYDPVHGVVHLSSDIYYNTSIASISVAAHEVGHAIQHKEHYGLIALRNRILPIANIASQLGWIVLVIGLFMFASTPVILYIGLSLIFVILLFQILTLPIEFNASDRAIKNLQSYQLITDNETDDVKRMLKAAAFTYVAAVLSTLAQILRILLMILGNQRRNSD